MSTIIKAETIRKYDDIDSTMAYVVDVTLFDSSGVSTSTIVGDSGIIREEKQLLDIFGNVVVNTKDSIKLETEYLRWNSAREKIETDAFVTIVLEGDTLRGYGMEADKDLFPFKILREVSGRMQVEEESLE